MPAALNFAALDAPHMTLLFIATIAGLTTALVVMFGELERSEQIQRVRVTLARLIDRAGLHASGDERDE